MIEHDATAAAIAEESLGKARALTSFVFLALGTGRPLKRL
jgi:predicted NBD/HSP70 family sugar kinase